MTMTATATCATTPHILLVSAATTPPPRYALLVGVLSQLLDHSCGELVHFVIRLLSEGGTTAAAPADPGFGTAATPASRLLVIGLGELLPCGAGPFLHQMVVAGPFRHLSFA